MDPYQHILIGLDLGHRGEGPTPGSRAAFERGLALAADFGARVTLLHSTAADEHWSREDDAYVYLDAGLSASRRKALDALLEEARGRGVEAELVCSEANAWLAIVRQVLREGSDLVVVAKRTDETGDEHKLGSVCLKLLNQCPCPVWAVKPGSAPKPRTLVAATDLTPVGDAVVRTALHLARHWDARCHIVDALQLPLATQLEGAEAQAEYLQRQREAALVEIRRQIEDPALLERVEFHVGLTSPTNAILGAIRRFSADLLVIGTVSRGGLAGLLVGNTAQRLFSRADCSILTLKPANFTCSVRLEEG